MALFVIKNLKYTTAAAGAAVSYFRLDRTISALPREVHYGLAGLLVAAHCQTGLMSMPTMEEITSQKSMSGIMYGVVGGLAFTYFAPRLGVQTHALPAQVRAHTQTNQCLQV